MFLASDHECTHAADVGCDNCDPAGTPRGVFGDEGGDYDELLDAIRAGDFEPHDTGARW